MRGLKKASLSKPKSCPNPNEQQITLFDCAFTSLKVEAHSDSHSPKCCPNELICGLCGMAFVAPISIVGSMENNNVTCVPQVSIPQGIDSARFASQKRDNL